MRRPTLSLLEAEKSVDKGRHLGFEKSTRNDFKFTASVQSRAMHSRNDQSTVECHMIAAYSYAAVIFVALHCIQNIKEENGAVHFLKERALWLLYGQRLTSFCFARLRAQLLLFLDHAFQAFFVF